MNPCRDGRHRNVFNIDPTCLFMDTYPPLKPGESYTTRHIEGFIGMLAQNGVDTVVACGNAQKPWYPSKAVGSVFDGYTRGDKEFFRGHYPPPATDFTPEQLQERMATMAARADRYMDLLDAGVDWFAFMAAQCRKHGLTPWATVRMNDMHCGERWETSFMTCPPQRDPACRLSGRQINPASGIAVNQQPLNYECRPSREWMFRMIREMIEDYDYEGIELDWLRCPFCCEPPASEAAIATLLDWVGTIRDVADRKAQTTGRPFVLGLRVPIRLEQCRTIGLDVGEMGKRGLIDYVAPSNSWQSSWDVSYTALRAELAESMAIYGVVEAGANWLMCRDGETGKVLHRLTPGSPELIRGNAAGKLAAGADGIYNFNFFCADEHPGRNPDGSKRQARYDQLAGVERLEALRGQGKQYVLQSMDGWYVFPFFEHAEQVPATLPAGERRAFRIAMCAEPVASGLTMTVQLVVEKQDALPELGVGVNGAWPTFAGEATDRLLRSAGHMTHHVETHVGINFSVDLSDVHDGINEILVYNEPQGGRETGGSARILSVEVLIAG